MKAIFKQMEENGSSGGRDLDFEFFGESREKNQVLK